MPDFCHSAVTEPGLELKKLHKGVRNEITNLVYLRAPGRRPPPLPNAAYASLEVGARAIARPCAYAAQPVGLRCHSHRSRPARRQVARCPAPRPRMPAGNRSDRHRSPCGYPFLGRSPEPRRLRPARPTLLRTRSPPHLVYRLLAAAFSAANHGHRITVSPWWGRRSACQSERSSDSSSPCVSRHDSILDWEGAGTAGKLMDKGVPRFHNKGKRGSRSALPLRLF